MEINKFLADNIRHLMDEKAPVAGWLAACDVDPVIVFERLHRNNAGVLDWRMDEGGSLFAKLPPTLCYKDWRPTEQVEGGATIIVGTALGYGLNHVLTGTPNSHKVLVVEPRPEMLLACLGQTDYRPFLSHGKLQFLPPDITVIEKALHGLDVSFLFARIFLRCDMPSAQMGPEYSRVTAAIKAKLESFSVELSTLRQKQEIMVGNELRNYSRAMDNGSLMRVRGMARGLTAVIAGAGPSLPRYAPLLAKHRDKAFIATSLQTVPAMLRVGIKPDLCLAIDYDISMMRCLDNMGDLSPLADIPFIYSTKMHPDVVARYPGPSIPLWTQGGIATYILKDQELVLDAGGNVGVTLERFLTWAGAERFVLVGQDLAWKEGPTHAAGHHSGAYSPDVKLANLTGETIYTTLAFLAAKRDMEADIRKTGLGFYNLYGEGVVLDGAINIDAEAVERDDLLSSQGIARQVFLDALDRAARPRVRPVFSPKAASWATSLKNASRRLEKLMRKAAKHQGEIRELLSQLQFFMRHDPLYMPYLYNEIMDMAGLIQTRPYYGIKEFNDFKDIRKRVQTKVKTIDESLAPSSSWAA